MGPQRLAFQRRADLGAGQTTNPVRGNQLHQLRHLGQPWHESVQPGDIRCNQLRWRRAPNSDECAREFLIRATSILCCVALGVTGATLPGRYFELMDAAIAKLDRATLKMEQYPKPHFV